MARSSSSMNTIKRCLVCLFLVTSGQLISTLQAQEALFADGQPRVTLYHSPPFEELGMPPAGRKFSVSVDLFHTESIDYPMKLYSSRDGVLTEVPPSRVLINTHDRPEYVFDLFAPRGEISYQFVYYPPSGPPIFTETFAFRRNCLENVAKKDLESEIVSLGEERLQEIVSRGQALEGEINLYTELNALVQKIKNEFDLLERE